MTHILPRCSFGILILVTACVSAADPEQTILRVQNSAGDRIEVVELRPSFDRESGKEGFHQLKGGQRMTVRFQYTVASVDGARIFVRPYVDGKRRRKFEAYLSAIYPKGSGTASGFFRLIDESVVDEIQIQRWSNEEQHLVLEIPTRIKGPIRTTHHVNQATSETLKFLDVP